jgi:NSS family neurotransmitter:Na+ symporter
LPILLLAVLLLRAVTLPGFLDGWVFYLSPVWSALWDPQVWVAAFSQILFTLTIAFGVMVAYASHKKEDDDIAKDSWMTALINSSISLFSGFVVFGILGYMATRTMRPLADLAASGPGLAFVVFPEALSLMPAAGFFAFIFFITLLSLGIDSLFSLTEAINIAIKDRWPKVSLAKISAVLCTVGFLCGIIYTTRAGLYFLDIVDYFVNNYNLVIVAFLQAILVGWLYGADKLRTYINEVSDWRLGRWWSIAIRYVVPITLGAFLLLNLFLRYDVEAGWTFTGDLFTTYGGYPAWAVSIGWMVLIIPLLIFLVIFIKRQVREQASG